MRGVDVPPSAALHHALPKQPDATAGYGTPALAVEFSGCAVNHIAHVVSTELAVCRPEQHVAEPTRIGEQTIRVLHGVWDYWLLNRYDLVAGGW